MPEPPDDLGIVDAEVDGRQIAFVREPERHDTVGEPVVIEGSEYPQTARSSSRR